MATATKKAAPKAPPAPKKGSLEDVLATSAKKYNLSVGALSAVAEDVVVISTGNLALDTILGVGGFPFGRSIELSGLPSSGKTTTALQAAVNLQRIIKAGGDKKLGVGPNDIILYLDYEQAMDLEYARSLGLDVDHKSFQFTQPDTLEDGTNFAREVVRTGFCRMLIFDSVAAMTPSARSEAEFGKSLPALQAKLMKDFGQSMNPVLAKHNCIEILINHTMVKVEMGGGGRPGMPPPTTTLGGVALKYFASIRMEFIQVKKNKGPVKNPITNEIEEQVVSTDVKVRLLKNKVAPPFKEAIVRVRFGKGFDNFWTALQILLANKKIIHQAGMYYFHNLPHLTPEWMPRSTQGTNRPYIKGAENVLLRADSDEAWRQGIIEAAEEVVAENIDAIDKIITDTSTGEVLDEGDAEEEFDAELAATLTSTAAGNRVPI